MAPLDTGNNENELDEQNQAIAGGVSGLLMLQQPIVLNPNPTATESQQQQQQRQIATPESTDPSWQQTQQQGRKHGIDSYIVLLLD